MKTRFRQPNSLPKSASSDDVMKRIACICVGLLLFVLGFSPIPGGMFLLAAGSVLLICASPLFRYCLQSFRARFSFFNRMMTWLENKTGERIGAILRVTQPGYKPQPGDDG